MLETFTCASFTPLVSETFRLDAGAGGPVDLVLTAAEPLPESSTGGGRAPFSLIFLGPPDVVLPQHTYPVQHPTLGGFDLFLVPIGADAGGVQYQAVFS